MVVRRLGADASVLDTHCPVLLQSADPQPPLVRCGGCIGIRRNDVQLRLRACARPVLTRPTLFGGLVDVWRLTRRSSGPAGTGLLFPSSGGSGPLT